MSNVCPLGPDELFIKIRFILTISSIYLERSLIGSVFNCYSLKISFNYSNKISVIFSFVHKYQHEVKTKAHHSFIKWI